MKNFELTFAVFCLFAIIGMAVSSCIIGCSTVPPERVAAIHKSVGTVLDIAYTSGGATLVGQKIDAMAAEGKITPEQAAQLKAAAKKSYEALQAKLNETNVKEVVVTE